MVDPHRPVGPSTVTARVAAIVLAIAARPGPSVTELAHTVRLPVSTTRRLLSGLVTARLVERTAHRRYELTLDSRRLRPGPSTLRAHITPTVADLAEVTKSRVRFGVWHERGVSHLDRAGARRYGAGLPGDKLLPIHATALGKALLAFAPDREVHRVLARPLSAYTNRTLTTPEALRDALASTRARGIAVAMREFRADEWGLGVPVFGPTGVIASLEISGTGLLSDVKSLAPALRYAALELGRRLSEYPAWLPRGTGRAPLRWPVDPTSFSADDDECQGTIHIGVARGDGIPRRDPA
jgi:DNA-binding IclR family transcriptional regulator